MSANQLPEYTFRYGEAADALCIGVLATQVFLDNYATNGIRPSLAREVLEILSTDAVSALLADPSTVFIVAETAGHMVGFAQITLGAVHAFAGPGPTSELSRLYVHESFTSKGVGTELLKRAEAHVADYGSAALWLTAWSENQRALAFYSRRGYTDIGGDVYVYEDDRYDVRIFARTLLHAETL